MDHLDPIEFARFQRQCANSYEHTLWQVLRARQRCGRKFRRQHPLGPYTADFYCAAAKLVVEVDGANHFTEAGRRRDAARDAWMRDHGIRVLRFAGKQVDLDLLSVCAVIDAVLRDAFPSPPAPLPQGERGDKREEQTRGGGN